MDKSNADPSGSNLNDWNSKFNVNSSILNLSMPKPYLGDGSEEEDDDDIEEVDETERLHLQKVSSLVEAAYLRVEKFNKQQQFYKSTVGVSEGSSCDSPHHQAASLPESLEGGKTEIEELKSLPESLESALRINQALQKRFSAALQRLEKTLEQNQSRQATLLEMEDGPMLVSQDSSDSRQKYFAKPSSFCIPYFKDRYGCTAPSNGDAKKRLRDGYFDLYSTRLRTWLTSERKRLASEVQEQWKRQLVNDWEQMLAQTQRKARQMDEGDESSSKEVSDCKAHMAFFQSVSAEKLEVPLGAALDWDRIAAQGFDGSRSAEECELLWENFEHPTINKVPFSEREDIAIQDFVEDCVRKDEKPNWEKLALKLASHRTPFQVMQRWASFIKPTMHPARWTPDQSTKLEDTINMLRVGNFIPWSQVSRHVAGYTTSQMQSRWRNIDPKLVKGPFTEKDDYILVKGLYKFGLNFQLITHFLSGRRSAQVRARYRRAILPGLAFRPWTTKEDRKIILNCNKNKKSWRLLTSLLPGRDCCSIRMRYCILIFWQSLSKDNGLPPPLFPLSLAKDKASVLALRAQLIEANPGVVKKLVRRAEKGKETIVKAELPRKKALLQKKVNLKQRTLTSTKIEGEQNNSAKNLFKRGKGNTWPDRALKEFFNPTAYSVPFPDYEIKDKLLFDCHMRNIGRVLQLRPPLLANDDPSEHDDVHQIMKSHFSSSEEDCRISRTCPLIAPCRATTTAFVSLLLHREKLREMATKAFLFYQ